MKSHSLNSANRLIHEFSRLPGIGRKTARETYFLHFAN